MKLPDDLKKLLASLGGGKMLKDHVESVAREAIGADEVQAYLGARISANFLELVGSGLFQQPAIMTMAQAVAEQLVDSLVEITEEHNQTCPKDHSHEIKAFKQLRADLEKAFDTCRNSLNKGHAHAVAKDGEHDEPEPAKAEGIKLEDIKMPEAIKPEAELIEFDALMKQAISKARGKKPIKAEVASLVSLLDKYEGSVEIMRKAQALIAGKSADEKALAITGFVKSIA